MQPHWQKIALDQLLIGYKFLALLGIIFGVGTEVLNLLRTLNLNFTNIISSEFNLLGIKITSWNCRGKFLYFSKVFSGKNPKKIVCRKRKPWNSQYDAIILRFVIANLHNRIENSLTKMCTNCELFFRQLTICTNERKYFVAAPLVVFRSGSIMLG